MADRVFFNCDKCPAYCCSYAHIPVTKRDIQRLAKGHGLTFEQARRRFTKKGDRETPRVMRHREDHLFESTCIFLDPDTRGCTTYASRPKACRAYPGTARCGYYDFLSAERGRFEDDELVIAAYIAEFEEVEEEDEDEA
jgi:Fe-S-cluster containining protein